MLEPVPVVVCGKNPPVAKAFIAALQPECEVIHLILSVEVGVAQVPALLRGEPQGDVENLGTQNYSKLPVAVILGKGYTDAEFKDMHEACQGESNIRWLRPDMATKAPDGEGYAKKMAEKMKTGLRKLADDGMMNQDGLYFF